MTSKLESPGAGGAARGARVDRSEAGRSEPKSRPGIWQAASVDPRLTLSKWCCFTVVSTEIIKIDRETILQVELCADGLRIADRVVLDGPNFDRVAAGQQQLAALCRSTGWLRPLADSAALHGRQCWARIWRGRVVYHRPVLCRAEVKPAGAA